MKSALKHSLAGVGASNVQFQLRSVTFTADNDVASKVTLGLCQEITG